MRITTKTLYDNNRHTLRLEYTSDTNRKAQCDI